MRIENSLGGVYIGEGMSYVKVRKWDVALTVQQLDAFDCSEADKRADRAQFTFEGLMKMLFVSRELVQKSHLCGQYTV